MRVTFCLADKRAPRTRIVMFIHWANQQAKIPTGLTIAPKDWNQKRRRTRNATPGGEAIDLVLSSMESKVAELAAKVAATGETLTREQIRATLTTPTATTRQRSRRLVDLYDDFLEEAKGRLQPGTLRSHRTTRNHLARFEATYELELDPDNLSSIVLDKLRSFLHDVRGVSNNTIAAQAKNLRAVLNRLAESGATVNPAVRSFRFKTHQSDNIALTLQEIDQIRGLDLHHEQRLSETRDCFLVQCLTGVRYGDLCRIRPENIQGNKLRLTTGKTSEALTIRLLEETGEILERYKGNLPVPDLKSYNERLKRLGLLAGMTALRQVVTFKGTQRIERTIPTCQLLSSHVARRTFVTVLMALKMQDASIMKLTGHKDPKMLQRYNRLTEESAGDELEATLGAVNQRDAAL